MNRMGPPPPRSTSFISFGHAVTGTVKPSDSSDNVVALGVDRLPFSARKYPAALFNEPLPAKKSLGSKVKDFFLNNQTTNCNDVARTNGSISNVEDLLKKYTTDSVCLEPGICGEEDSSSVAGNNSNSTLQCDNISYSSISNISNATDLSTDACAATLTNMNLFSLAKPGSQDNFATCSPESHLACSLNRSSSACETCQSQDSGFLDCKSPRSNEKTIENNDKTNGFTSFLAKGLFSRLKNPEPSKEKLAHTAAFKQKKSDEFMAKTTQTWLNDILPQWERGSRRWRQTHELWWLGLPPKVRGQVWKLTIGNELNISSDLYKICLDRAACVFQHLDSEISHSSSESPLATLSQSAKPGLCNSESADPFSSTNNKNGSVLPVADKPLLLSLPSILLDLSRTFPQLGLFQDGGPMHGALKNLLSAYTSYRPDVGYVQGMSFIASMLLLNMDEYDAFVAFTNIINRPLHLAMFSVDRKRISAYVATFKKMLWSMLPELAGHFAAHRLSPDVYLFEWLLPIFCKSFSLDVVSRIWDVYIRDGEHFLFKVALAILKQNETNLLASDFDQMVAILANVRAQAELTSGEQLFISIRAVSKTRIASSESFAKLFEESIAEDADRWCENSST